MRRWEVSVSRNKRHGFVGYVSFVGLVGFLNRLTDLTDLTVITGLTLLLAVSAHAATVPAASCSRTDVGNAVAAAASGDTVSVPAGICTWSSTLTINKSLTLLGAGSGATKIVSGGVSPLIEIALIADVPVRVSGFSFDNVNYPVGDKVSLHIGWNMNSSFGIHQLRIDHNAFNKGKQCIMTDGSRINGVIDHNDFLNCDAAIGANGDIRTWDDPIAAGTANALFIEDNTFRADNNAAGWSEQEQIMHGHGNRTVIRYNTFDLRAYTIGNGLPIEAHGNGNCYTGTSNDLRGMPILEIYNNTMRVHATYRFINIRGGSDLVHDNTLTSEVGNPAAVEFKEEEGNGAAPFTSCAKTAWAAEDQINNSFVWNNTLNGQAVTDINLDYPTDPVYIQQGRDYFMHAPAASGGKETYTGRPGGLMSFSAAGANAYYPYTPYTYPHPLVSASNPPPANTFYIRDGGTSSTCSDWTNACDTLPAALQRGATYYIADGIYPGYDFNLPAGTSLITVKKATPAQHGTSTGWQDAFGDGQANFGELSISNAGNFMLDGQSETVPYGFHVSFGAGGSGFRYNSDVNNVTLQYTDFAGPNGPLTNCAIGIWVSGQFTTKDRLVIRHNAIHGSDTLIQFHTGTNMTVEYNDLYDTYSTTVCHGNVVLTQKITNGIFRYNRVHNWQVEGFFITFPGTTFDASLNQTWNLYGNVFFNPASGWGSRAIETHQDGSGWGPLLIYNNTFANLDDSTALSLRGSQNAGTRITNNLFYNNPVGAGLSGLTHDYNWFFGSGTETETHIQNGSGNPFINAAAADFRLSAGTLAGLPLSAPFDRDPGDVQRGADGSWDRGAYEFGAGSSGSACTQTLSVGANIPSAVSSAVNGSTICLNNGNYGSVTLANISRTGFVTLTSVSGSGAQMSPDIGNSDYIRFQSLTLTSGDVGACSTHIEFVRNTWLPDAPGIRVDGTACSSTPQYIAIDGDTFDRVQLKVAEGRLSLTGVNTVAIKNCVFSGNPSNGSLASDGIQMGSGSRNVTIGPGNYFHGLYQDQSSGPHVDSIQCYNATGGTQQYPVDIVGNYFYDNTVFLGYYDGACGGLNIHDNIFDTGGTHTGGSNCQAIQMGGLTNVHFNHNTLKNFACGTGIGTKNGTPLNAQWIIENNIVDGANTEFGASGDQPGCGSDCIVRYNLKSNGASLLRDDGHNVTGNAVYTGAPSYANWLNWQLTTGSPGHAAGNDGRDMGTLFYGAGSATVSACDLNRDSATNVSDVQQCVNQAIGTAACSTGDIDRDGSCTVVDVQRVVNAALGGQCVAN
jgi:hypothetical protein